MTFAQMVEDETQERTGTKIYVCNQVTTKEVLSQIRTQFPI